MRTRLFSLLLLGLLIFGSSKVLGQTDLEKETLTLRIEDLIPQTGVVRAALFQSSDGFPNNTKKAFALNQSSVTANNVTLTFENIPFGIYAISVYQDLNNDHRLNKSILGIPKEPIGFSNDPPVRMGPPHFNDACFTFDQKHLTITIHMRTR